MTSDLDTFRSDTRAWLEANCPAEMRLPMRDESDACWGGRDPVLPGPPGGLPWYRVASRWRTLLGGQRRLVTGGA